MIENKKANYEELLIWGYPKGDINDINDILRNEFSKIMEMQSAFSLIIEYKNEGIKRLGFFLDCKFSNENIERIYNFCQENIGEIDIFYFEDLSNELEEEIQKKYLPFYKKNDGI
ncbi:hypothetical protein [Pontimicrobium sp. MEBiC01747]